MSKNPTFMSDPELLGSLKALVRDERGRVVLVLKHLAEVERRRLAQKEGFPELFDYCVRELRYAHGEAARRIQVARVAVKYPVLFRALDRGLLSLTTASLLCPHLRWDNYRRLIRAALGKNRRAVEALVAPLMPGPQPVERVRYVVVESATVSSADAKAMDAHEDLFASPAVAIPTESVNPPVENAVPSPEAVPVRRVHFSFTADEALLRDVERAKELLRHRCPSGKLESVFSEAFRTLLEKIDPERRFGRQVRRRASGGRSRAIPLSVKDTVWRRDGGRCSFTTPDGRRCGTRAGLEVDHIRPWALGGVSDDPDNLRLLCRAHNGLEARRAFGDAAIDAAIASRRQGRA